MKKPGCLILCALMLALVLMAAGVPAGAAEPDSAIPQAADVDPEALLEAVTEATGGIPDTLAELEERYDLDKIPLLEDVLGPMHILDTLMAEGTCSFPTMGGDWPRCVLDCNDEYFPMDIKFSHGDVVLTLGRALPEDLVSCSMRLDYSDHTVLFFSFYANAGSESGENSSSFYVSCTADGEVNGFKYFYQVIQDTFTSADGSLCVAISFIDSDYRTLGSWWGYYDVNGMLESKEFLPD